MEYKKIEPQINDFVGDNVKKLAQLFPSAVKDGQVDFQALKEELGQFEEVGSEKYELTWAGKQNAKKIAQEDVYGKTLKFIPEESVNADTTENLYIEGDNLEVLKLLRQNYYGAIKMIYIDPPYNTGKDFVYNDKFAEDINLNIINNGDGSELGERYTVNTRSQNRYHANWLNMMYPRLKIAKELLKEEGVIFISIDSNEMTNLKNICNEIFGAENIVGEIVWQTATDNNPSQISMEHEYVLCYAKNITIQKKWLVKSEKANRINDKYLQLKSINGNNVELIQSELKKWIKANEDTLKGVSHYSYVDSKGVYYPGNSSNTKPGGYKFDIIHPITKQVCKKPDYGYRWTENTFWEADKRGDVEWGKDESTIPKIKKRIETVTEMLKSYYYEDNRYWTKYLNKLFGGRVFENPKSVKFLVHIMKFVLDDNEIVLDFFSGSASTAHSVLELNRKEHKNVKYILVQLPEETSEKSEAFRLGYRNICEIGKERIRRVGQQIITEDSADNIDIGFKCFRIGKSNIRWNLLDRVDINQMNTDDMMYTPDLLDFSVDAKDYNIVYELVLREKNLVLSNKIERLTDLGERIYLYADSFLVVLESEISLEIIEKITQLNPLPIKFIFRDSAFGDDIALKDETIRRLKALIEKNSGTSKKAYTVEFI